MRTLGPAVAAAIVAVFVGSACGARSQLGEIGAEELAPDAGRKSPPTLRDSGANAGNGDAATAVVAPFDCAKALTPTTVLDGVGSFAIDGETIYATSSHGDTVFSFPRTGGSVALVGSGFYHAHVIAASQGRVFVTDLAGSLFTEKGGEPLEHVMRAAYASTRFAVDDHAAYGEIDDHVVALSLSDGTARILGATNRPSGSNPSEDVVLTDDARILWADGFGIGQISKTGGEPSVLVPRLAEGGIMADADGVLYVPNYGSIVSVPDKTGAPVTRLTDLPGGNIGGIDYGSLAFIQLSARYFYWLVAGFSALPLRRMPRDGGAEEDLTGPLAADALLLDRECLYWVAWDDLAQTSVLQAMRLPE